MRCTLVLLILFSILPLQAQQVHETAVEFIELSGLAAEDNAELSSLVWFGDTLLLIAENPQLYPQDNSFGSFFAVEKTTILDYLSADNPSAIEPYTIPIYADDLIGKIREANAVFDGFEAAAIIGNTIYLQIEAFTVGIPPMKSFIVSGDISDKGSHLEVDSLIELPVQTDFPNLSYESLVANDNNLIAIYEANGPEANPDALAYTIDLETEAISTISMPNIPYRITDASEIDEEGNFWAINYFYSGESYLGTDHDPIFDAFGIGASQTQYEGAVERLIELHYTETGIELLRHSPIQIHMTDESYGRNWEGLARVNDIGLLLVTDKFPETLFAFVPFD
jgi:hypothetical protein